MRIVRWGLLLLAVCAAAGAAAFLATLLAKVIGASASPWAGLIGVVAAPQLSFPRDRDFKPTPGIFGKLEIRFGG